MLLNVQILSLMVSFLYGCFFYILLELNVKFIYSYSLVVRVIVSFLFVLFNTLLYFLILVYVNNGYVHVYFLFSLILGYIFCNNISIYENLLIKIVTKFHFFIPTRLTGRNV